MSANFRTVCRTNVHVGQMSASDKCPVTYNNIVIMIFNENYPGCRARTFAEGYKMAGNLRHPLYGRPLRVNKVMVMSQKGGIVIAK